MVRPRIVYPVLLLVIFLRSVLLANGDSPPTQELEKAFDETQKLAPPGFTTLVQAPFIVAGDEPPEKVRQRAASSVQWVVERLKQDFFTRDPSERITIWLFKDKTSYETNTRRQFQEEHPSPYGFYSPRDRALIMNISTGAGTLVHEIVHPYMRANFPRCPAWFNEGLASLFEACEDRNGHIHGLPNWRLPGLQKIIRETQTLSFQELTAMSDAEFYGGSTGYNQYYGQSRYLCYYLQEHGLLIKFYREFLTHADEDPTGFSSLKKVLETEDMAEFQLQWESFILKLHYP